ncbi:hypothetical protein [Calothrix sp. FACHB-168]|nr:hypothetical protein [Calothrix sp. FACHB-168]
MKDTPTDETRLIASVNGQRSTGNNRFENIFYLEVPKTAYY